MRFKADSSFRILLGLGLFVTCGASGLAPSRASALPMFARKYHMECGDCHDSPVVPRLNEVGYRFRRAGFRMPERIGQDELSDFSVGDYFSGKVQASYRVSHVADGSGDTRTENRFEDAEVSLYPMTGSFLKWFATEVEIGIQPDATPEVENAYIRAVWGNQNGWLQARAGVFHPIEGFGGSDRSLGPSRPLFVSESAFYNQDTLVRVSDLDRLGAELGSQWGNTSFNVAVLNRLNTTGEGKAGLTANGTGESPYDSKDILVSAHQIFGSHSALGGYWLHGSNLLPSDPAAFVGGTSEATWRNDYNRLALFASLGNARLQGLAGGSLGFDQERDPATGRQSAFRSAGGFIEGTYSVGAFVATFLRFDYFQPALSIKETTKFAGTLGATFYKDPVFLTPELRYVSELRNSTEVHDIGLTLKAMAIY